MSPRRVTVIRLALLAAGWAAAVAPAAAGEFAQAQHGGIYIEPPATVDPRFLPTAPDTGQSQPPGAQTPSFTVRASVDYPLRSQPRAAGGSGAQGSPPVSPTAQLSLRWQPLADAGWFAQTRLFRYLRPERRQPWDPDFAYSFGYEDWRPGTLSLVYDNYAGNRLQPERAAGERRFNFSMGTWSLAYRFALPERLAPYLLVGDGDQSTCRGGLRFAPRYADAAGGPLRHGKTSAFLGCRYTRPSGWWAELTAFAYPEGHQQQPWDPDFSYAVGYDTGRPGTFAVQYGNYSGNRLPWRSNAPGQGTLRGGSVSVSWMTAW